MTRRANYSAAKSELSPYLETTSAMSSDLYLNTTTSFVGELLTAIGQVLIVLEASRGQKILEYGPGDGMLAIEAAKVGCEVTVVDIEQRYLRLINERAKSASVSVRTVHGEFGDDCGKFDRILFYEAFHHSLDHAAVVRKIRHMLTPGGFLVLAGEPVVGAHNAQWLTSIPYPWGLRFDGASFAATQTYGWLELGFREDYFVEMLMREGFTVSFRPSPATDRGSAYVARPYWGELDLGAPFLLRVNGRGQEWHAGEGEHRWTGAEEATIPLRAHDGQIAVTVANYLPRIREFEVATDDAAIRGSLAPNETRTIHLPADRRVYLRSQVDRAGPSDPRMIGLAAKSIRFV